MSDDEYKLQRGWPSSIDPPLEQLAYWYDATKITATSSLGKTRWRSEAPNDLDVAGVMPAAYVMIGKIGGQQTEAWLDAVTGSSFDDPQLVASARAEAARWRGDTAAAKRWDDRLAAIRALTKDDCSQYLLRYITKP